MIYIIEVTNNSSEIIGSLQTYDNENSNNLIIWILNNIFPLLDTKQTKLSIITNNTVFNNLEDGYYLMKKSNYKYNLVLLTKIVEKGWIYNGSNYIMKIIKTFMVTKLNKKKLDNQIVINYCNDDEHQKTLTDKEELNIYNESNNSLINLTNTNILKFYTNIKQLILDKSFNKKLDPNIIPNTVTYLELNYPFILEKYVIPSTVTHLILDHIYGLEFNAIPNSVTHLTLNNCNNIIKASDIPNSITHLILGPDFYQMVNKDVLPNSIIEIDIYCTKHIIFRSDAIPNSLQTLRLHNSFFKVQNIADFDKLTNLSSIISITNDNNINEYSKDEYYNIYKQIDKYIY